MITKTDIISDILKKNNKAEEILREFGMGCLGCPSAARETLEDACSIHGIDIDEALKKLNS